MSALNKYYMSRLFTLFAQVLVMLSLAGIVMIALDVLVYRTPLGDMGYDTFVRITVITLFFTVVFFGMSHYHRFALQNHMHRRHIAHATLAMQLACSVFLTLLCTAIQLGFQYLLQLAPPAITHPAFNGFLFLFILNMLIGFDVILLFQSSTPPDFLFPGFRTMANVFLFGGWFIFVSVVIQTFLNSALIYRDAFFHRAFPITLIVLGVHLMLVTFFQYRLLQRYQCIPTGPQA